jgi:hypothetical protein
MTWRTRILWFFLGMVFTVGCYGAYRGYIITQMVLNDPYYVWHAAALVIKYMETHQNRWPASWDELGKVKSEHVESSDYKNIEKMKEFVVIDWNAEPSVLVRAKFDDEDQPAFRVIWLRNGRSIHWGCAEPNRLIWEYLQRNKHRLPPLSK